LRRDIGGNVLFITAAMMIPFLAFSGCAVDAARLYFVKMRLQQACDAGVLAGRKFMTSTTELDDGASAQAAAFFNANFRNGWFGTSDVSFTPSRTDGGQVAGSARATVPMTVMSMFGIASQQLDVDCEARFDVADTDIIFVLDTTGSMACLPNDSDAACNSYVGAAGTASYTRPADGAASGNDSVAGYPGSTAYYVPEKTGSRIAALRTAVVGFYDTLAAASDPTTHIRYGFVTYTSTVNAGKAIMSISPAYMVGGAGSAIQTWNYQSRRRTSGHWLYQQRTLDVGDLVGGGNAGDDSKSPAVNTRWAGCIEERATTAGETSFNQSSLPNDLDPDLAPSATTGTQWAPMWPEVVYARNYWSSTSNATSNGDSSYHPNLGSAGWVQAGYATCGKPVSRLKVMSRTDLSAYVNAADFRPLGGTYHDTGMIWGTRLLSPGGIFAGDTAAWPGRAAPNRVIVFLTDGDMAPSPYLYGMYGVEYYDRRVSGGDFANLKDYHNARFLAECAAAKARNISVWTVSIAPSPTSEMQQCASTSTQALATTDGTGLSNAFAAIARQVAMLRLSR
jgi:Flp pilus assembly protein TadG